MSDAPTVTPADKQAKTPPKGMPKTTKIILEENDNIPPTGLFLGINGRTFLIPTGVEVAVPQAVISVLDDAVVSFPTVDPQTRQIIGYRDRLRYPYRRVAA